jgi:GWxTD domain-containing protein
MLPWLVAAWCAGVAIRGTYAAGGWWVAWRDVLKASGLPSAGLWQTAADLARRLGVTGRYRLVTAERGTVPFVFGWLKPVLIMPVAALAGLSSRQLEAVLAHELAHIARYDALVNAFQTVVDCLLFYHPAVWWVSRRMREEREHCCDDLAVEICGDRLEYSRALLALEETRAAWVLATSGGHLTGRISRLLGRNDSLGGGVMMPLTAVVVLSVFLGGSLLVGGQAEKKPGPKSSSKDSPAASAGVAGGTHAGVAGAVPGGVSTGVPGGIVGGVPGGVAGGVRGGVPGGVSRGVTGGVGAGMGAGVGSGLGTGTGSGAAIGTQAQGTAPSAERRTGTEDRQRDYEKALRDLQHAADLLMRDNGRLKEQLAQLEAELQRAGHERLAFAQREHAQHELARQQLLETLREATRGSEDALKVARGGLEDYHRLIRTLVEEVQRHKERVRTSEMEFERRMREVEERFKDEGGKNSDRGAVYLEFGAPAEIETNGDLQIWRYRETPGIGKNVEFRFEGRPLKKVSGPIVKDK